MPPATAMFWRGAASEKSPTPPEPSPPADRILYSNSVVTAAGSAVAVDAAGNAYVVGTAGQGLATTPGAFQPNLAPGMCSSSTFPDAPPTACSDAFAIKVAPDGSTVYATYLGG